jgi:hypothetical protein
MPFRYSGLDPAPFAPLHALDDDALMAHGMRRVVADARPGFPCRVTLEDALPGERLLLLNFEHQPAHSPYRASGPIFVREGVREACDRVGAPPQSLLDRLLSVRAYAADGMMIDADATEGSALEALLARLFANPATDYVHVHYARRGCYAARVTRA